MFLEDYSSLATIRYCNAKKVFNMLLYKNFFKQIMLTTHHKPKIKLKKLRRFKFVKL